MKITIITVSYNSGQTIEKAILSVINQDYKDIEYIIVDGGSTDGTVDIIKKYENYIYKWISEPDQGIYDAMNKGIAMATGDVIAFLNSDDWYMEDTLAYVSKRFQDKKIMILAGEGYVWQGEIRGGVSQNTLNNDSDIRFKMTCFHPSTFARKEVFEKIGGFDTNYKIAADYAWMLKAYDSGIVPARISKCLSNFEVGGASNVYILEGVAECKRISLDALNVKLKKGQISEDEYERWLDIIIKFHQKNKEEGRRRLWQNSISGSMKIGVDLYHYIKGKHFKDKKIGIFGTGAIGSKTFLLYKYFGSEIICFYDNNAEKIGEMKEGLPVFSGKEINNALMTVIASTKFETEIEEQLIQLGLEEGEDYISYSQLVKQMEEDIIAFYD